MTFKYLILLIFISLSFKTIKPKDSLEQQKPLQELSIEKKIDYKKGILGSKLDYQLVPTLDRKFTLKITNSNQANFDIQIYDVIGNLILTDKITEEEQGQKEFDFSKSKTKIFVVKVVAGEENVTKKITI